MSAVTSLSRNDPTVDPGGQAAVSVKVRNAGSIVDRFDVDVVGPSAGWARVDPPSLSLFPGVEGTVTITWAPPRASSPRAGVYPFGIRVRPAADPSGSTVEEGKVSVTPFTSVAADIVPVTSRGSRTGRHQVVVANRGNASSEVAVTAEDPDARLRLMVQPPRSVVAPDAKVAFAIRVDVDDPFPFGPERQRPFQVSVTAGRQAPIALRGVLTPTPGAARLDPAGRRRHRARRAAVDRRLPRQGRAVRPEATPAPSIAQVSAPPSAAAPSQRAVAGAVRRSPVPAPDGRGASRRRRRPPRPRPRTRSGSRASSSRTSACASDPARGAAAAADRVQDRRPGRRRPRRDRLPGRRPQQRRPALCLVPDGGDRTCQDITAPATVTAPNDQAGERSWHGVREADAPRAAPRSSRRHADVLRDHPVGDVDRQRRVFGRRRRPEPGLRRVQRDHPRPRSTQNLLDIRTTFVEHHRELRRGASGSSASPSRP